MRNRIRATLLSGFRLRRPAIPDENTSVLVYQNMIGISILINEKSTDFYELLQGFT